MLIDFKIDRDAIKQSVWQALEEDLGTGDVSAQLIPLNEVSKAKIIAREPGVLAGQPWVEVLCELMERAFTFEWFCQDGESFEANQTLCYLAGNSRALLTAERTILNYLQTLSGTASETRCWVDLLATVSTKTQLLDTRKTLPGLRLAQKYAVRCGGGMNHRFGLYDAYLIKENHILACGSIKEAVFAARAQHPELKLEVEVENFSELEQAIEAKVDVVMLDNFSLEAIEKAVKLTASRVKLEVSGNVSYERLPSLAATGVDFISTGALTKHVRAIDLSLRFFF